MPKTLISPPEIDTLFEIFAHDQPAPQTELIYSNPFTLLVAVVLSAQATDKSVNKATTTLFKIADTPEKMLALGEENLKSYIQSIGLYKTKAKNIMALSHLLIHSFHGQVPNTREDLEQLPGVGRKTANVVLSVVFDHPTLAVDTHVFRVANRIGLANDKTPLAVEKRLLHTIPSKWIKHAHHWLILHGRYICTAQKPKCYACPVSFLCRFPHKKESI